MVSQKALSRKTIIDRGERPLKIRIVWVTVTIARRPIGWLTPCAALIKAVLLLVDRALDHPANHFFPPTNISDGNDDHCVGICVRQASRGLHNR